MRMMEQFGKCGFLRRDYLFSSVKKECHTGTHNSCFRRLLHSEACRWRRLRLRESRLYATEEDAKKAIQKPYVKPKLYWGLDE